MRLDLEILSLELRVSSYRLALELISSHSARLQRKNGSSTCEIDVMSHVGHRPMTGHRPPVRRHIHERKPVDVCIRSGYHRAWDGGETVKMAASVICHFLSNIYLQILAAEGLSGHEARSMRLFSIRPTMCGSRGLCGVSRRIAEFAMPSFEMSEA